MGRRRGCVGFFLFFSSSVSLTLSHVLLSLLLLFDFCQSGVGVKEGKKADRRRSCTKKLTHLPSPYCLFSIFGKSFRFHFPKQDRFLRTPPPTPPTRDDCHSDEWDEESFPLPFLWSVFSSLHTINESQQTTPKIRRRREKPKRRRRRRRRRRDCRTSIWVC